MRKELSSAVKVKKPMAVVSEAPTASIPSVSNTTVANSSHSRMVVAIQIPFVQACMLSRPIWKIPAGLPSKRDTKYDFPERYGPHMERTANGLLMVLRSSRASFTSLKQ